MTQPHLLDRRQGASTYLKDKWGVSYKRWSRLSEQIFRIDKWSVCRG